MRLKNKTKIIKNYWGASFLLTLLFLLTPFFQKTIRADQLDDLLDEACEDLSKKDCEDLRDEADDKENEFDTLENQLKNAEKLAKLKKQQAQTLTGQVQILNLEINNIQGDIGSLENEILITQDNINTVKKEIKKKSNNIKESQKNLGEMLRSYYKLHQNLGLSLLTIEGGLDQIFTQSDYLSQISTRINNALKIIREEKEILGQKREEQEIEKGKLNNQKSELDKEKQGLALKKNEKNNLLVRTKGEEVAYKALITKIESRMKQLLIDVDSLTVAEQGELNDILKDAKKPKKGLASTKWYYSQTDKRWSNEKLGGSRYTIGDSGCAITSIAMVFTYHDEKIDPEDLTDVSSFTNQGYIDWYSPPKKFDMKLATKYGINHGNISWSKIKDLIDDDDPVIVYINGGRGGHYVVIHGYDSKNDDFVVHDPYWGANLLLGTSKKLVSSLYKRTATVDQMIVYKPD